jgi:hypothetical protein
MSHFGEFQLTELKTLIDDALAKAMLPLHEKIKSLELENVSLKDQLKIYKSRTSNENKELFSNFFKKKTENEPRIKLNDNEINLLNAVNNETKIQEKKEKNVIVFGLKESKKNRAIDKNNDDLEQVKKIIKTLNLNENIIKKVNRFPKKDGSTNPGLLQIEFGCKETALDVLKASKMLKSCENNDFINVFINPDLTLSQRVLMKKKIEERNEMNQKISIEDKNKYYYGIRNFSVVKISKLVDQ